MGGFKRAMLLWLIFKTSFIVAVLVGLAVWWLSGCAPQPITITINGQQPVIASAQAVPAQGMAATQPGDPGKAPTAAVQSAAPAKASEKVPFFKGYRALVEYNSAACRSTAGRSHRDEIVPRVAQVVGIKLREQGASLAAAAKESERPPHSVLVTVCVWDIYENYGGQNRDRWIAIVEVRAVVGGSVHGVGMGDSAFCRNTNASCSATSSSYAAFGDAAGKAMDELISVLPEKETR